MKKRFASGVFVIMLLCAVDSLAQKKLKSELTFERSFTLKRIDSVKAILFVYEGSASSTYAYSELSKTMKWRFKNRYEVGFQYNLTFNDQNENQLRYIPLKTNGDLKHQMICKIRTSDFREKRHKNTPHVQRSFNISVELIDPKTNELAEFAQLKLAGYSHLRGNNEAIAEAIERIILGNRPKKLSRN